MKKIKTRCPKCDGALYSKEAPYDKSPEIKFVVNGKFLKKYFAKTMRCITCGEDFNISTLKFRPIK